ncbi:hypothetical protein [Nocardia sp. BMG51109]|uniref:hypothetical protein n=1 Tax=Nocardia sp. BMG51109 TaxID=1056816 RepID=UPI0004B956DB|nr:hypothetical protein [Nocardia sp. BMG51109]
MTTGSFAGSTRVPALGRRAAQEVAQELAGAFAATRTGYLHVSGDPGGRLRVVRGRVLAITTVGAPALSDLLARPGRALPGDAERRALAVMAALDASFAIASGWIDGSYWSTEIDLDPAGRDSVRPREFAGVEADQLIAETERRLRALANSRISPHRNRLARTEYGDSMLRDCPAGPRQEILAQVDGRHRCRDLAFVLGHGLYPVTVEVSRLLAEHALVVPSGRTAAAAPKAPLPRRRRDASGINELYPPPAEERSDNDPQ